MRKAKRIRFIGVVQGVGLRPYIKITAERLGLGGYVRNLGGGEVEVYIEGEAVDRFLEEFLERRPEAMYIEEVRVEDVEPLGLSTFLIVQSGGWATAVSIIPPDLAICDRCLKEALEGSPRRRGYVFNSCSYCGPRFSILRGLPYDRENTSWSQFPMCRECREEYDSPAAGGLRRYFYQGQSCRNCGPRVRLVDKSGAALGGDPVAHAAELIEEGRIVAVKGVGGFHLAALATVDDVVAELRRRKRRPTQPFAVMALDVETARRLVHVSAEAERLLLSPQRPIVLLPKREDTPASPLVSPGLDKEGVFLPYSPLHYLLLSKTRDRFLVMTSCNVHGLPMCRDLKCVLRLGVADYVLDHDLEIVHRVDDSVLRFTNGEVTMLRRGRGYAPMWVRIPKRVKTAVTAVGADLQNAAAVAVEDKVVLTQHIGDLDNVEAVEELEAELNWFKAVYRIRESVYVCDANPAYVSTRLCKKWGEESEVYTVYHHHAHALAAAADWGEESCFTSIAIDGVGYGPDGNVWGGEVMLVCGADFVRFSHLAYVAIPGGDAATYYPARMAISYLSKFLDREEVVEVLKKLGLLRGLPRGEVEAQVVLKTLENSPLTSSAGRFLDAVSALLGISLRRSYEGEPAILLESHAAGGQDLGWRIEAGKGVIDSVALFRHVYEAATAGISKRHIAYTAQYSLGLALGEAACEGVREVGNRRVYVGGGAAVNDYVVKGISDALKKCGGETRLPRKVPPGDGGIALGQVYYVAHAADT